MQLRASQISAFLLSGFLALMFPLAPAFAGNPSHVEFRKDEARIRVLSVEELRAIAPVVSLEVFEAHERENRVYRAIPGRQLFDSIFGKDWRQAQEIVFTSLDGYQPSIPVEKFLAHEGYLALAHVDGTPFTLTNRLQNDEVVPLGPLYLIWDNIDSNALLEAGASDMPYQVTRIELKSRSPFPNMIPPQDSSDEVQRGFRQFRQHCAACHTINGDGGAKAPELNYPVSVTEYIQPEYLKRWVTNPQSIRYNTTMPGLAEEMPDREKIAEEIIAYLKAMSSVKRVPAR